MIFSRCGRSSTHAVISRTSTPFRARQPDRILASISIEIDNAGLIARTDRQLFHVEIRCLQQRPARRRRHHRQRIRHRLRRQRRALKRLERDAPVRSPWPVPTIAPTFSVSPSASPTTTRPAKPDGVQRLAHCRNRGLLRRTLVTAPDPSLRSSSSSIVAPAIA